jgi:hypothetical protein
MQHRLFLTTNATITLLRLFFQDVPLWVSFWIVAPVCFVTWLTFHWIVGFWQPSMAICGLFAVTVQTYLTNGLRELRWQQFQVYQQLDRERQALQATQETLQCMLSSM